MLVVVEGSCLAAVTMGLATSAPVNGVGGKRLYVAIVFHTAVKEPVEFCAQVPKYVS